MNYYINPMWFYWVRVIENLRVIVLAFVIVGGVVLLIATICGWVDGFGYTSDENEKGWRIVRRFYVLFAFIILLYVFLPSKETLIEMMIARNITEQSVKNGIEVVKGAVDYIVQAIQNAK